MARIRTIKPDFFRHEGLQDLERDNPGSHVMLTFAGLWTLCDKAGRFEWKPRTIKLDVLPFLDFDMGKTLALLERFTYVRRYEVDGKTYGVIPSFEEHQRISGKEAQEPPKYPEPVEFITPDEEGSSGEATGKQLRSQEGKGREREKEGEKEGKGNGSLATTAAPPRPLPVERATSKTEPIWRAYSDAYRQAYGADPVRNAKVNGQLANIVDRIGAEDAPAVAAWFVQHRKRWYVEKGHSVECLQKDCEQLRTEWATGRRSTSTAAIQADRTQTTADVFGELYAEAVAAQEATHATG